MGRPNQCDPCCGDIGDPPDPPISQCDDVICIALIDENEKSVSNGGTFAGRDQMAVAHPLFRAAYPNRLLFVLDCFSSSKTMYYSQSFLDDPLAFSLRVEFDDPSGPAGLIRLLARDNGDNAIATANNPWGRILAIKEHYPSVKAIFDAASEISVFVDDSSSLQGQTQMEKTIISLKADAISAGYIVAGSTDNTNEDIICPFAQSQCCTDNAQPLMDECGVDVNCGALSLSFIKSPDDALIREYCTNVFPSDSLFQNVCSSCVSQQQEQEANTIEYTALATNSQGQNAEHVEIRYSLQASDNGTDWITIENLDSDFSGVQQGLNALIDNWGGSSLDPDDCHQWLSDGGEWGQLGSVIDGEDINDRLGYSVSLNSAGDRIAIGIPRSDFTGLPDAGQVKVFEWNGSSWTQLGDSIDHDWSGAQLGAAVSLNAAGDRIVVGAPLDTRNAFQAGRARVLEWNGTSWVQMGNDFGHPYLDMDAADVLGRSVSINAAGNRVAISWDGAGTPAISTGEVRVFEWNGTSWIQLGSDFELKGDESGDRFGFSVSLNSDGDRVAIGAPYNDAAGYLAGRTKIFQWNGSSWTQLGSDIDGEVSSSSSGYSVSINSAGDRVAIGAPYKGGGGSNSGHTRIFEWNGVSWVQLGSYIDGEAADDLSGLSVSLNAAGDRVAIGAPSNTVKGNLTGHTRIFEWNGTSWIQLGSDIDGEASSSYSGLSVSLNSAGDRVGIGAPWSDGDEINSGDTRIFNIDTTPAGACLLYQDTTVGNCDRRIWTRQFRIKAETIGYPLTAFSDTFKIYELRSRSSTSYFTADGEWVGGAGYGDGITLNPNLPLGGGAGEMNSNFGYSVSTAMSRGYNSFTDSYYPRGTYWTTDTLYRRVWKMVHDSDGSRSPFDPFKATRYDYPNGITNPIVRCGGLLFSESLGSLYYLYDPINGRSISSTVWHLRTWAKSYGFSGPTTRLCGTATKGGTVYRKSGLRDEDGYGFFVTGAYDLDSNVIVTPYFRTRFVDVRYRIFYRKYAPARVWYDVFISGDNVTPGQDIKQELRYYKLWIDSSSIAEFGQLSLISTLETPDNLYRVTLDYYSNYYTIDDTDVFAQQGGYIKLSTLTSSAGFPRGSVIYYFGGDDWRQYSANFTDIQSELYPEVAGDGNYLYKISVANLYWSASIGGGLYTIRGEVYSPSESKYYPGIFVVRVSINQNGNTTVTRYGKPVASFVENDGFGRYSNRVDCNGESLVVGAPEKSATVSTGNDGAAVYYYMWTPNI